MDKSLLLIQIITYLLTFNGCHTASSNCSGFAALGHTLPVGDIFVEYGTSKPLEIMCIITNETIIEQNPNISSLLSFEEETGNNQYSRRKTSPDKIIRLNETSIKLVRDNPEKMDTLYRCMFNGSAICFNKVYVGIPPINVTDFKCVGYNYENLTCSWTPPKTYVATNFSLSYTFPNTRPGKRRTDCTVIDDKDNKKKKCFWSLATSPHYRQVQEIFIFTLESKNRFGSLKQVFLFEHLKNILSEPPENLSCVNSTTSSLFLTWNVPHPIVPFPGGLEHRILYQCGLGPRIWQLGGKIKTAQAEVVRYNLTNLKHAHDLCDVRVAIRTSGTDSMDMWSANSSLNAYTSSTIPGAAPRVNIGSFQIDTQTSVRDIYVYWQQIPMEIKNAEGFGYAVTVNDGSPEVRVSNSYAKFANMSLNTTYTFTIRSSNAEGLSKNSSVIVVPANEIISISDPVLFTKVAFENGLYKLSWEKPIRGAEHVENYTLFWCNSERDRPFQCSGYLNWTEVPANTTEYNVTVADNQTTQFAISANTARTSSGMFWATCTVMHNKKVSTIKDVWITHVGPTFIELRWKLGCDERSDNVVGYIIYYCRRGKEPNCENPMKLTINDATANSGKVTGLTPYTTYVLMVAAINEDGTESIKSDPHLNTTFEDVSTEPLRLQATEITNSTVTLEWDMPIKLNGFLRSYEIFYNDTKIDTLSNETAYTIEGLQSDTTYNISVAARTAYTSNKSIPILISTKVGYPGRIDHTFVSHKNNTPVLTWETTAEKRRLSLYEFSLKYKSIDENVTQPIINTTENKLVLENCGEDGRYSSYYFKVRALNMDNGTRYEGPWSDEAEDYCERLPDTTLIWILMVLGCVAFLCTVLFGGKKIYVYIKGARDIEIKLPQGLDPQITSGCSWPEPKQSPSINSDDEERLLHTMIPRGGDSSGCSSGLESVSSDSGSSITNTSDSGTEQPRTPLPCHDITDPLEVLSTTTTITAISDENSAVDDADISTYIQFDSAQDKSPPYVMAANLNALISKNQQSDPLIKPIEEPTSSYVQAINLQEKNPPYVLAANKDALIPDLSETVTDDSRIPNTYIQLNTIQQEKNPPYVMAENLATTSCDQMLKMEEPRSVNNNTSTYVQFSNTQEKANPNPPYVMAANKNVIMPSNLYYPRVG